MLSTPSLTVGLPPLAFLLAEDLEVRGHAAGEDHLAGVEAERGGLRAGGGSRGLKLQLLDEPRAEEEGVEAFERERLQAGGLALGRELSPVDGRRQVLPAGVAQHVCDELVPAERAQRALAPMRVSVKPGRLVAVVHGDDEPAFDDA